MGKLIISLPGGGADLDVITAAAGDVLANKIIVDKNGDPLVGTMPNRGAVSQALNCGGSYIVPAGCHNGNGKVTANSLASQTAGTAAAADIRKNKTAWVNGDEVTGAMAEKAAATYTPKAAAQTIAAKQFLTGAQTIQGDSNFIAANIKKGVKIWGITGTWEGYVATPNNLYYHGINNAGFEPSPGASAKFDSGQITLSISVSSTVELRSTKDYNMAGYKSLKIVCSGKSGSYFTDGVVARIKVVKSDSTVVNLAECVVAKETNFTTLNLSWTPQAITGKIYVALRGWQPNDADTTKQRFVTEITLL